MQLSKFFILFFLSILVLSSCETDLIVDKSEQNRLVVYSMLDEHSSISVELSKTRNILNSADRISYISDAHVTIFENGVLFAQLEYNPNKNRYETNKKPKAGFSYALQVKHDDYKDLCANATVPPKMNGTVEWKKHVVNNQTLFVYDVLLDKKNLGDFLIWELLYLSSDAKLINANIKLANVAPDPANSINEKNQKLFIKEKESTTSTATTNQYQLSTTDVRSSNSSTVQVKVASMSKEAFNYYRSIELYKQNTNQFEPVSIYSNVENGLGIFGAKSVIYFDFEN